LGPNAPEEQVASARQRLGLDQPPALQFFHFAFHAFKLDFGNSFIDSRPVGLEVRRKIVNTATLTVMAVLFIALYLTVQVLLQGSRKWSRICELSDFLLVSLPTLFSAVLVALTTVAYYPFTRFSGFLTSLSDFMFLIPAAFVLACYPMGILGRILRRQMHLVSGTEYVRAARARGLSENRILRRYILRNSWLPIIAAFGNQLPLLLTSTFIVEIVFSIPGIGSLLLKSVLERDLPMMEGIIIVTSLFTLMVSFALEVMYQLIDPRIRSNHVQ